MVEEKMMNPRVNNYISTRKNFLFTSCAMPDSPKPWGLLLVNPLPLEQNRCSFFYRNLQLNSMAKNIPSMRFDYTGSGDSTGSIEDTNIDSWIRDTELCCDEFKKALNLESIYLLGIRIGGTIASIVASQHPSITSILIDPVYSGEEYVRNLDSLQRQLLSNPLEAPFEKHTQNEIMGFPFPPKLRESIISLNLEPRFPESDHTFFSYQDFKLAHFIDEDFGWNNVEKLRLQFIPKSIHRTILDIVGGEQ